MTQKNMYPDVVGDKSTILATAFAFKKYTCLKELGLNDANS